LVVVSALVPVIVGIKEALVVDVVDGVCVVGVVVVKLEVRVVVADVELVEV
jgi:hypothetical protein